MAKSKAFKLAELIRGIEFDITNDKIVTTKAFESKNIKKSDATRTSTDQFSLDTFAHADFRAARYIVAMSKGSDYHSTEIMLIHDAFWPETHLYPPFQGPCQFTRHCAITPRLLVKYGPEHGPTQLPADTC